MSDRRALLTAALADSSSFAISRQKSPLCVAGGVSGRANQKAMNLARLDGWWLGVVLGLLVPLGVLAVLR